MTKFDKFNENEGKSKTILIFGINSFVGSNLAEFLKNDFRVVGTYYHNRVNIPGIVTVPCDVLDKDEVQLTLYAFRPDVTIYAVGLSSIIKCAESTEVADALNTGGLINVIEFCQRYKSQICYISSSFVFDGENKDYIEMDIPDANTVYGKAVAASEFYIQKTSLNYIIFRCCKLYGRNINPTNPTWFEILQSKFFSNSLVGVDNRVYTGFLDIYYLALLIKLCVNMSVTNRLFQVSSTDVVTMFDFAKIYSKIFGESENLISKTTANFPLLSRGTGGSGSKEKYYYKMDITNIEGFLLIKLPTVEESLNFTYSRFHGLKDKSQESEGVKFI